MNGLSRKVTFEARPKEAILERIGGQTSWQKAQHMQRF